jgi:integrase
MTAADNELSEIVRKSRKLAPRTKQHYLRVIDRFVAFAGTHPSRWTPTAVEAWLERLNQDGVTENSCNNFLAALGSAARRWAAIHDKSNFVRPVERFRGKPPKSGGALTHAQAAALLVACAGSSPVDLRDRALVLVGLHGAFRRFELCNLELERVTHREDGVYIHYLAKRQLWRTVVLTGEGAEALSAWLGWLHSRGVKGGPVFRSMRRGLRTDEWLLSDKPLSASGLAKVLGARAQLAGLDHFHPHMLRHTHVSWRRAAGEPDWKINQTTGHSAAPAATGMVGQGGMIDRYTHDVTGEPPRLPRLGR